ncbi:hypothetical protein BGZ83_008104 [Gryganskiella cystojenkinii]|nr:hypothetical protein BGZ83_008104 [Gryganskiella cystojenkinii]
MNSTTSTTRIGRSFSSIRDELVRQNGNDVTEQEWHALKKTIEDRVQDIQLGLDYFKKPSTTSRTAMATAKSNEGEKYSESQITLAKRLSDVLKVDELQALNAVNELAKTTEIPSTITPDLVLQAVTTHWKERITSISLLGDIIRYELENQTNPEYEKILAVDRILGQSVTLIGKLMNHYTTLAAEDAPEFFASQPEYMDFWIEQSLTEQSALIETAITLALVGTDDRTTLPSIVLTALIATQFGKQQHYLFRFKVEAVDLWEDLRLLAVVLSIASLDLGNLFLMSVSETYDDAHVFKSTQQVQTINTMLQRAGRQQELGPFILAWSSILSARMINQLGDETEQRRLAGQLAFVSMDTLSVFKYLHQCFGSEQFDSASAFGTAFKDLFFQFLELVLLDHQPKAIKDFENLVSCLSDVVKDESGLCNLIWQDSPTLGRGTLDVLETARGRFPVQLEPMLELLSALATGGEESANHAVAFFQDLPTLSHMIPLSSPSVEVDADRQTGATVIRSRADVPFGFRPGRPFMMLPRGMTGHLISGENAAHIVQWRHQKSGWELCYAALEAFQQANQEDYSPDSSVEIKHVEAIMKFLQAFFTKRAAATAIMDGFEREGLNSIIPTIFAILDQCSKFQKSPLAVIASCVTCLTGLCESYVQDVWLLLKQSAFLPSVITTTVQFTGASRVQTSGQAYTVLVGTECMQGNYSVTLAFLDLLLRLTKNAQDHELWDSREIRCLKSEVLYPCLAYLQNEIFSNYDSWHYLNLKDRFSIGAKVLTLFNKTLDDLPLLSGTSPEDYIGTKTLQDYLIKNFLYDGGKQLALPLVSIIGNGPDMAAHFSKYARTQEMHLIKTMVFQGLNLTKSLLTRRKIQGGPPSFLEVYMIDRTVGRANVPLVQVLASYNDFSCGQAVAHLATNVLALLCALTAEWPTRPSLVGYFGTTVQAQQLISTIVSRVGDDLQLSNYRIALWSFITITLSTQPGLATLFLSNNRVNPFTTVLETELKELAKTSILVKACDILKRHKEMLAEETSIVPHALLFLDVLFQNAKDHALLIMNLLEDGSFWKDLGELLSRPDVHTKMELVEWPNVAIQYNSSEVRQVAEVSRVSSEQQSVGHALRIVALAVHFQSVTGGIKNKDVNSLPTGLKSLIQGCIDQGRFQVWNETIPTIYCHVDGQRELRELSQILGSPFDHLKLAVRRWSEEYDTDHGPGESFMLDLEIARRKLIWRGTEVEHNFLRALYHVNLNWSTVHSEMERLAAWRFFVEILTSNLGSSVWSSNKPTSSAVGAYYDFVNTLMGHIQRDTQGSVVLRIARHHCCMLLQAVIEKSSVVKRSDKKNMAAQFPDIVVKLQKLLQISDLGILESVQNPVQDQSAHQPLLLTLLYCYRALHDKEVLSSMDASNLEVLRKSAILLLPLIASCFVAVSEIHLLGQQDHSENIVVLLALLEELCHPIWNPHPTLWIPTLRNLDVFRVNLALCARSFSSANYESRPSFVEGSLNFLLALANVPEMAVYLCDAGVMSMVAHNGISPLLQRGEISHLDKVHGDRGNWHHAWCMILATVTSLLRSMSSSEAFMQHLIAFIQLYGNQISKGLETSTDSPLTSAKLEEMERITMLFYELSKYESRLEVLGGGDLLRAFFDRSLFILQHATYLFTHPHTLSSVISPITKAEQQQKQDYSLSTNPLSTLIEGKLASVVRNILSAILAWTDPAVIFTKSNLEWPLRKTTIAPIINTPVYEPASIGTMFDLVQYASTSLKEWEARLEGKAGGAAGLYKDSGEDDGQKDTSLASSTSTTNSKTNSKLAWFGDLSLNAPPTSSAGSSSTAAVPTSAGSISGKAAGAASSTTTLPTSGSSTSTSLTATNKTNEAAFATLSSSTGSSIRMLSLLEDALVVMTTQLGLYMYHPQLDSSVRRDIQDQCMDLISTLNATSRMLQRFENVPVQQRKDDGLSQEAQAQIKSLRETMIPILKNFAETKINIQRE